MPVNKAKNYYDHPVFHPLNLSLDTPMMASLLDEVTRWMWNGATGGMVYGAARIGKTTALSRIATQLQARSGQLIPVFYVSIPGRDQKTITSVLRHLCDSAKLAYSSRAVSDQLSHMFLHHMLDVTKIAECSNALLIVDEMQRLNAAQFDVFAEMYDQLRLLNISLTVLFSGNDPECFRVVDTLGPQKHAHIVGRFFLQSIHFKGLCSAESVRLCLGQYDTLRFPESGPTYTEYFLKEEFKKGWRLEGLAADLWRIFSEYKKGYKLDSWGMQHFTSAVNALLADMLPTHGCDSFCDDMMHECIRVSGLVPSLVRTQ
jgi:AAA domain